jgi:glycosyltransferase involved in cell wall biosynthesis
VKIVLCHNFYRERGGEDSVFRDEGLLLESRGHQVVHFIRHNNTISDGSRLKLALGTIWNREAARELRELVAREGASIVHFHNTLPLISPAAYYAARQAGAAVVQTLHNYRMLCPKSTFFRGGYVCEDCRGKLLAWPAVLHGCYRDNRSATAAIAAMLAVHSGIGTYRYAVDRYIACSNFSRDKFLASGWPAHKIVVKPNFLTQDPGCGDGDGGYAMYLGRLSPEKGVDTLLAAWQKLGGRLPLKIVGNGPLAGEVEAACRRDRSIEWLSGQTDEQVRQSMQRAAFLVLPSVNYEGFPRTIVEAYATGTPVVASRLGAMAELILDNVTGRHFEPGSPDDLADKASRLFADAPLRLEMRDAARLQYEEKYTADRNYELLMDVYEAALAAARKRRSTSEPAHT